MKRMLLIFIIDLIFSFIYASSGIVNAGFFLAIVGFFLVFMLIGIILLNNNALSKTGKICYIIGIIGFLPLSLIGYFGMKQYVSEAEDNVID